MLSWQWSIYSLFLIYEYICNMSSVVRLMDDEDDSEVQPDEQRERHISSEKEIRENKIFAVFMGFAGIEINL